MFRQLVRAHGAFLGLWGVIACSSNTAELGSSVGAGGLPATGDLGGSAGSANPAGGGDSTGGALIGGATTGGATTGGTTTHGGTATNGGIAPIGGTPAGGLTTGGATADGGTAAIGGAATGGSGGGANCALPNRTIQWGWEGGFGPSWLAASLGPDGFVRVLPYADAGSPECRLPYDCADWGPELAAIRAALGTTDLEQALAAAPVLYGIDPRPSDGFLHRIVVDGQVIDVGCYDYASDTECTGVPSGVKALLVALLKLERRATLSCFPECLPQPLVFKPSCSQNSGYVWTGGACGMTEAGSDPAGLDCDARYDAKNDCADAHRQCFRLFVGCGGSVGDTCDADEYCAYTTGQGCGSTAHPLAVCVPRPRSCPEPTMPVCGCDQRPFESACLAAMAGQGVYGTNCPSG